MAKKYKEFFQEIKKLKEKQKQQKQRGLNDYNMVNVVRKATHEVGMHSNVIYSLINPNGLHYQGDLFLQIFIKEVLEIPNFGDILDVQAEEVTSSLGKNKRIDFTIKGSNYYIGIEMKVNHHDSDHQIYDYYLDLKNKAIEDNISKEIDDENLRGMKDQDNVLIYYLTKNGKEANPKSSDKINYIQISFDEHILNWIEKCQQEVRNITNLNEAFENYKQIVQKITNKHQSKVIQMNEFLENNIQFLDEAFELKNNIHKMLGNLLFQLFQNIDKYMKDNSKYEKIYKEEFIKDQSNYFYTKEKCSKIFYNNEASTLTGLQKTQYIGSFYKLTDTILLRVELATEHFHIGLVSYEMDNEKYKIVDASTDLTAFVKDNTLKLEYRTWNSHVKWYSIDCDNFISPTNDNKLCFTDIEKCHLIKKINDLITFVESNTQ